MKKRLILNLVILISLLLISCTTAYWDPKYEDIKANYKVDIKIFTHAEKHEKYKLNQLDIPTCLKIAFEGNPDYKIIEERIRKAQSAIKEAEAILFFPSINFSVRYIHADSAMMYFGTKLDQREYRQDPNQDINNPDDFGSSRIEFNANYRFNLGGSSILQYKIAKLNHKVSQLELKRFKNILVSHIINAYFDTLASKKFVEIAKESVKTVSSQLEETKVKYQGGSALKSDVLALEVRLAEAKENVIKAKNRYNLVKNGLAHLLGLDPDIEIELVEKKWDPHNIPSTYKEGILIALAKRPELEQARKRVLMARYGYDLAKTGYYPNLDLFAKYYYEDRDFKYNTKCDNWMVGAQLTFNIFDGFLTYAKMKGAKSLLKQMLLLERKTVLQVKHEVDAAYRNWKEAKKRVEVLKLALKQAEENLYLVKNQFEGGSATITKYLTTEFALTNTKYLLTKAQYDLKKTKALLGKALGLCSLCSEYMKQWKKEEEAKEKKEKEIKEKQKEGEEKAKNEKGNKEKNKKENKEKQKQEKQKE